MKELDKRILFGRGIVSTIAPSFVLKILFEMEKGDDRCPSDA